MNRISVGSSFVSNAVPSQRNVHTTGLAKSFSSPSSSSSSSSVCPTCGGVDLISEDSDLICTNCGSVLQQNHIVSSVEYIESGGGGGSVAGQFVSGSGKVFGSGTSSGGGFSTRNYSQDSRQSTLLNGKRKIQQVAGMLHLGQHFVDAGCRLFMLAVSHNFTIGRKAESVVAACLYVVCRREKSPHLLIDFADKLQVNVFVLGSVFLKFCRLLNLSLPILDPSLYIHRFASQLPLREKTHLVATTALRLVASMKRDWIETGRRPSSICGAALLISARTHSVLVTRHDVMQVVNIGDDTLRRRLVEFSMTPLAQLRYDQVERNVLTSSSPSDPIHGGSSAVSCSGANSNDAYNLKECDPPCFQSHRQLEAIQQLLEETEKDKSLCLPSPNQDDMSEKDCKEAESEKVAYGFEDDFELAGVNATQESARLAVQRLSKRTKSYGRRLEKDKEIHDEIEAQLKRTIGEDRYQAIKSRKVKKLMNITSTHSSAIPTNKRRKKEKVVSSTGVGVNGSDEMNMLQLWKKKKTLDDEDGDGDDEEDEDEDDDDEEDGNEDDKEDDGDLSELDDEEISSMLLSKEEVEQKEKIWLKMNAQYLKERQQKLDYAAATGNGSAPKRKKKISATNSNLNSSSNSLSPFSLPNSAAQDAIHRLKNKSMSSKINYDVLADLLGNTSN